MFQALTGIATLRKICHRIFSEKRNNYYKELGLPLYADKFIAQQKQEMAETLEKFDQTLPKNDYYYHDEKRKALDYGSTP